MARMTYVIRDGKLVEKHLAAPLAAPLASNGTPAILGDIEPFVSPIDGSVITGRAALRAHCQQHGVVPTAELKGLPPKLMNQEYKIPEEQRRATREYIAYQLSTRRN